MKLPDQSFFADLYAVYYIPITPGAMIKDLRRAGFEALASLPPMNLEQWYDFKGGSSSRNKNVVSLFPRYLADKVVWWRYCFRFKYGLRVIISKKFVD
jgi:hypothetical protein